jgi:hypothetical protein
MPTHKYASSGNYNVKLIVLNDGLSDTCMKSVDVSGVFDLDGVYINNIRLDVDGDLINDFSFSNWGSSTITQWDYIDVTPLNNFEIFTDSVVAWTWEYGKGIIYVKDCIPRIFIKGDTLHGFGPTAAEILMIQYYYSSHSYTYILDGWIKDEFRYIGYRKMVDNQPEIGWIKIKVLDRAYGRLYGYKSPTICESLVIEE